MLLHQAVFSNSEAAAKLLLERGANPTSAAKAAITNWA